MNSTLNSSGRVKTTKFDKDQYKQTDLYRFSNLRSEYLAEANIDAARVYMAGGAGMVWRRMVLGSVL